MVSHDCIAFYLLSEAVSKHVTVVQSGQGADELLAGYDWYPPLADVPPEQALEVYAAHFFDRNHQTLGEHPAAAVDDAGRSQPGIRPQAHLGPARVRPPRWTRRCGWTRRSCWSTTRSSGWTT